MKVNAKNIKLIDFIKMIYEEEAESGEFSGVITINDIVYDFRIFIELKESEK